MRWVIHIGTQKTGSKAIQLFLNNEPARIRHIHYCLPKSGRSGIWHQPLYEALQNGHYELLKSVVDEGNKSGADVGILSYEGLHMLESQHIQEMMNILGGGKIVLFIRRQDQFVNSMYNQLIKAHRVTYSRIMQFQASLLEYNSDYNYLSTIQKWGAVFGQKNILPIIYDKQACSIRQFLDRVHLSADFSGYKPSNPNPALDAASLSLFLEIKQQCINVDALPRLMTVAHQLLRERFVDTYSSGEEQYLFSMREREQIYRHYLEANEQLRALFFPEQNALFPPLEYAEACRNNMPLDQAALESIFDKAGVV